MIPDRPHRVHAWQWTGDHSLAVCLVTEWGMKTVHPLRQVFRHDELAFSSGGEHPDDIEVAEVGDWVLTPDEGISFFALPEEDFRELYADVSVL